MKFSEFLPEWTQLSGIGTEDILSCFLPLVQETLQAHQRGRVAPLHDIDLIQATSQRLWFEEHLCAPPSNAASKLNRIEAQRRRGWNIVSESNREVDLNTGAQSVQLLNVVDQFDASTNEALGQCDTSMVRYVTGYACWEHSLGHHDPLTDIFSLGMILASLALQLDFHNEGELQQFVVNRENLFRIKSNLHPVLAQIIRQTTELHRDARPQELTGVLRSLENYRDQSISIETQLALDQILNASAQLTSSQRLLLKLRDRLFDLSRRNPLLNFRNTAQALNLTQASVPITININNIRADQLMIWDESLQASLAKGQPIRLNQRINLNEAVYASSVLERLIADARRDRNEYGCSQLRLVVAFLSWSNLKEKPIQSYVSPLVLAPIEINKQKGIKDTFTFEGTSATAEVNPVIRHLFRELYNISLPESIELEGNALDQLFELLRTQINASEPAITLHKVDRPRIELIHEKAKRRLDQYRRSSRVAGRGAARFDDIEYSYDTINYHPLGVRLFSQRVKQPEFHLQRLMSTGRTPRSYVLPSDDQPDKNDPPTITVQRDVAVIREAAHDDPYQWSFDLCSLTLVNLHYRRMSLVRDYEAIAQQSLTNPAFEAAFRTDVKSDDELSKREPLAPIPMSERFEVVISDPTQSKAIARSRTGASYIVQGPPGTGKSQTITNLIADFVAQGKRVLFVCEKRAAIDVVYARLSQCGLGSLCSLVHDSQTDKKEFIQDLQATYQAFTGHDGKSKISSQRQQIIKQLTGALAGLARYEAAMQSTIKAYDDSQSISMRALLDRLIASPHVAQPQTNASTESPSAMTAEPPTLPQWWSAGDRLPTLQLRLQHLNAERIFNAHPLHALRGDVVSQDNAASAIVALAQRGLEQLAQVAAQLDSSHLACDPQWTIAQIQQLLQHAQSLQPLSNEANLALLDPKSPRSALFLASLGRISDVKIELASAQQRTQHWRKKLPPDETRTALSQARQWQNSLWRWFLPGYWKLRKILNEGYDFAAHQLKPSWTQVLEDLQAEHDTQARLEQVNQSIRREMSLQLDPLAADELIKNFERDMPKQPEWLRVAHEQLLQSKTANDSVAALVRTQPSLAALGETNDRLLAQWRSLSLENLRDQLQQITAHIATLPSVADLIQLVDALPPPVAAFVRTVPLTFEQMEARVTQHTWHSWLQSQPDIDRFHAGEQATHIEQVEKILPKWLSLNAQEVCERARERFLQNSQPNPQNPALSKRYQQGRKVLEHEFGKTMRYRPIRELVDGDSGLLVRDLKPIWLMSPLSVSDTLPLTSQFVDVVIFDEASQVRLEDAVPTLFRGVQTIIVGDTMQLPPTNFFAQKSNDLLQPDEADEAAESVETLADADLSSDSLLRHAGKRLPSTMLGWHYRSRSESLISFSNWAFYDGHLLTVPDVSRATALVRATDGLAALPSPNELPSGWSATSQAEQSMVVREPRHAYQVDHADFNDNSVDANQELSSDKPPAPSIIKPTAEWLGKPISFHFLENGCYDDRRNEAEAMRVAELVEQCLSDGTGQTIGVIAFSEAQQSEIERALEDRARESRDFAVLYERELNREEDGQFCGLLVKNLENIQGDERDVIILSVCYGPNPQKKISMNFGPINRDGGEKRLNVAFSRAKRHMAVVSSIRWGQITNDYNFGPSCLKQYLRYAECHSLHDRAGAELALAQLGRFRSRQQSETQQLDMVTMAITAALKARGYEVDNMVGQSMFRVQAAVYLPGDATYRLGILVDTAENYATADPWERDVLRPRLLNDFGWQIMRVLGKDWWKDSAKELERILENLPNQNPTR